MYTALYRTERPETFDEILGQEHIVKILKNQVKTGTVGHAYLFTGTRGTGKTSTARILAKAVNCTGEGEKPCGTCPSCRAIKEGAFIDMIEIDAASNNGVDNVRELRESVNYPPAVGKKKVYIIDEAHMLTTQALNALLKTLEEPPENIMFILATTDPQKLLQTILSRCLRLDFRRIPDVTIAEHMRKICEARGVSITQDALRLLASNADGSVRDGLSLLDQCLSGGGDSLNRDTVLEYLGTVADDFFIKLTNSVIKKDAASGILMLDEILRDGKDVKQLVSDWLSHYRSLLVSKYVDTPEDILNMSTENVTKLIEQSRNMDISDIEHGIMTLSKTVNDVRYSSQPRILMELAIVVLAGARSAEMQSRAQYSEAQGTSSEAETKKTVPQTTKIEKTAAPDQETAPNIVQNLRDIWEAVWDKIGSRGSMVMVRLNSRLAEINDTEFKVIFNNRYAMEQAERNAEAFVNAMSEETGKTLRMVAVFEEQEEAAQQSFLGDEVPISKMPDEANLMSDDEKAEEEKVNGNQITDDEFERLARELETEFDIKTRIE